MGVFRPGSGMRVSAESETAPLLAAPKTGVVVTEVSPEKQAETAVSANPLTKVSPRDPPKKRRNPLPCRVLSAGGLILWLFHEIESETRLF